MDAGRRRLAARPVIAPPRHPPVMAQLGEAVRQRHTCPMSVPIDHVGTFNLNYRMRHCIIWSSPVVDRPDFATRRSQPPMSLINTTIKPFKATAFHAGKFVEVSDQTLKGQMERGRVLPGRLHLRLPDGTRGPGRPLHRVPEARRRDLQRLDRHPFRPQGLARHFRGDPQGRVPDDRRPDRSASPATSAS